MFIYTHLKKCNNDLNMLIAEYSKRRKLDGFNLFVRVADKDANINHYNNIFLQAFTSRFTNIRFSAERTIHKCEVCNYETINIHNYESHILNNHSSMEEKEKKFTYYCKACNFGVFTESSYNNHLNGNRHNIKIKNLII